VFHKSILNQRGDVNATKIMKKRILIFLLGISSTAMAQQKVAIFRWYHNGDTDWVDARANEEENLLKWGYTNRTFVCYLFKEPQDGTVAITRWTLLRDKDWVSVPGTSDASMQQFGYESPIILGYAYPSPRANTIPTYRLYLERDKDWVTAPESSSSAVQGYGYINKTLVAYTPK
jgi:hypothetical protein